MILLHLFCLEDPCLAIHHASLHGIKTFIFHQIHSTGHFAKAFELIVVGGRQNEVAWHVFSPTRSMGPHIECLKQDWDQKVYGRQGTTAQQQIYRISLTKFWGLSWLLAFYPMKGTSFKTNSMWLQLWRFRANKSPSFAGITWYGTTFGWLLPTRFCRCFFAK